jgi:hypothetical protein
VAYFWRAFLVCTPLTFFVVAFSDDIVGSVVALVVGAVWAFLVGLWNVHRVLAAIRSGDRQALVYRADAAITRMLRQRNNLGATYAVKVSSLVRGAGAAVEAEKMLASVPVEYFIGGPFWLVLHALAFQRIKLGMYPPAEAALDRCGMGAPSPLLDREHRYLRGLVDAATSKPRRALERMEEGETPERDVVMAHACVRRSAS